MRTIIEPKVTYVSGDAVSVTSTGTIFAATGNLARGDAYNQFTGNLIKPNKWTMRFTWSTAQVFSTVRLVMFRWLDATAPAVTNILQYSGDARAPHSPFLWTNIHKIKVIHDWVIALKPRVASGYDAHYDVLTSGGFPTIQFDPSGISPLMNGLYCLIITDDIIGTAPQLTYTSELTYTDA